MRACKSCGELISEKRLLANPLAKACVSCLEAAGDVSRVKGLMVWDHKTAPSLQLLNERQAQEISRFKRKGVHAQLPLASTKGPGSDVVIRDEVVVTISTSASPSRCHPERPRVGPSGKCIDCCLSWYIKRTNGHLR